MIDVDSGLDESKQTHCTRCNTRYSPDEYGLSAGVSDYGAQWYAISEDSRLPAQPGSLGYCEICKRVYYAENREQVHKAYQAYLDAFPTHGYIYGLIDPRYRLIYYIGRTYHLTRRIREHRRDDTGNDARAAYTRWLHEQELTFEWCKLSTVTPGYYVYEMEARWICHALQHDWPLTNKEAQDAYNYAREQVQISTNDFFTCSPFALPLGDRMSIRRVEMYVRWLESKPAVLPEKHADIKLWLEEGIYS